MDGRMTRKRGVVKPWKEECEEEVVVRMGVTGLKWFGGKEGKS